MGRVRDRARAAVRPDQRAHPGMSTGPALTGDAPHGADWSASLRKGTDAELRRWLEIAVAACDEADEIARRHFRRDLQITTKPDRTFVTQADTAIEEHIRARLSDAFPEHGLIGEEYGAEAADASVRWYIDPI